MRIRFQPKDSTIVKPPGGPALPVDWDALTQTIMTEIEKFLPSPTIPIDLKDVATPDRFINGGISVDNALSRFALRADNALDPLEARGSTSTTVASTIGWVGTSGRCSFTRITWGAPSTRRSTRD